ncbi:hypothetical protein SAMN04488021_11281 [Paracoccus aminovorans]|uniref:DUF1178 family protein n=1 Tax=Paracoccus aminovorans TaxID=34004 RepID=A0A1I3A559_9RHOB|nr:DUF1178 family protein [Paracoccus aminovorans]CQR84985.1 hypothetical protein JCM7685_0401 [Paracoccus aminovorans]SFH45035.1 hypothetical protein SAMN04488021_11281 [Paracoccus aminovorans]
MIRYALRCDQGHDFDGWFRNSEGFDSLLDAGQVSCTHCGSVKVAKALMAPKVAQARDEEALTAPRDPREAALEALRRHVEANSDYVGMSFAAEARAMHEGEAPARAIHGEAKLEDAKKLLEDGIPVAPLPFRARQRVN